MVARRIDAQCQGFFVLLVLDLSLAVVIGVQILQHGLRCGRLQPRHLRQHLLNGAALLPEHLRIGLQLQRAGGHVQLARAALRQRMEQRHRHKRVHAHATGGQGVVADDTRNAPHAVRGNFVLDGRYKIALAGGHHHHQLVDLVKRRVVRLHPFELLVHRQPQAPANLLQLGDFRVAGRQFAQRENVGVVPAFLQRPHRENEAQIGVKRQQLFLFLQDQPDGFFLAFFTVRARKVTLVYSANVACTAL